MLEHLARQRLLLTGSALTIWGALVMGAGPARNGKA